MNVGVGYTNFEKCVLSVAQFAHLSDSAATCTHVRIQLVTLCIVRGVF